MWDKSLKHALNMTALAIGKALDSRTKNSQDGQFATNNSKPITVGNLMSVTDMYGNALRSLVNRLIAIKVL